MQKTDWMRVAAFLLNALLCLWVYSANEKLAYLKESDAHLKEFLASKIAEIDKRVDRHENGAQHPRKNE